MTSLTLGAETRDKPKLELVREAKKAPLSALETPFRHSTLLLQDGQFSVFAYREALSDPASGFCEGAGEG